MVIDDFTAEELPIPANTEHGEGSPRVVKLEPMSRSYAPTFKGRITVIGDDIEPWNWDCGGYWVSASCAGLLLIF